MPGKTTLQAARRPSVHVGMFPLGPEEFEGPPTVEGVRQHSRFVSASDVDKYDRALAAALRDLVGRRRVSVVGVYRQKNNVLKSRWAAMQPGEPVLFLAAGAVIAQAPVIHKAMSWQLGEHLWPPVQFEGRRYHHLLFLGSLRSLRCSTRDLVDHWPRVFETHFVKLPVTL
jgi:hypothetical protein